MEGQQTNKMPRILPNSPSSCHHLVHFLSAISHTYTSALSLKLINSLPSPFPPFAHPIDFTPAFIFRLPMTCPVPDFQSTRCTYPHLLATANTSPVGLKVQISMLESSA